MRLSKFSRYNDLNNKLNFKIFRKHTHTGTIKKTF